jgi:hypothetical protein
MYRDECPTRLRNRQQCQRLVKRWLQVNANAIMTLDTRLAQASRECSRLACEFAVAQPLIAKNERPFVWRSMCARLQHVVNQEVHD